MRRKKFFHHPVLVQNGSFDEKKDPGKLPESSLYIQCRLAESNCGHMDFQSIALPTELKRHHIFQR